MKDDKTSHEKFNEYVISNINSYRKFMFEILLKSHRISRDKNQRDEEDEITYQKFVTIINNPKCLDTFCAAITHSTICSEPGKNYEILENIGDVLLKYCFTSYLYKKFEGKDFIESQATSLLHKYMQKKYQADISRKLGLINFALFNPSIDKTDLLEDLFESMFGCISQICLITFNKYGVAVDIAYNLITYIMDDIMAADILDTKKENYRMYVKEAFEAMGCNEEDVIQKPILVKTSTGSSYVCRVAIPPHLIGRIPLINELIDENGIFCESSEATSREAKSKAANMAYSKLLENKLTMKEIRSWNNRYSIGDITYEQVMNKMKEKGYIDFMFKVPRSSKGVKADGDSRDSYTVLVAISKNGDKKNLLLINEDNKISKKLICNAFLSDVEPETYYKHIITKWEENENKMKENRERHRK